MRYDLTTIKNRFAVLRNGPAEKPLLFLCVIGSVYIVAFTIFAVIPFFLPDTNRAYFPPYIALPQGDFELSNYYFLYAFLSFNTLAVFGLFLAGLKVIGKQPGAIESDRLFLFGRRLHIDRTAGCIFIFAVIFHALMLAVPTLLSTDIFDYIRHGRIFAIYGENPIVVPATYFPQDPFYDLGGWVGTGSVYGPLHVYLTGLLALISGDSVSVNFIVFKTFFVCVSVVNMILIWGIAARLKPGLERKALLFYGWNPFVLILVVANAHNDLLMLMLVLAGFLLYLRSRILLGALAITLAVLVKFIALPILFLYIALVVRNRKDLVEKASVVFASLAIAISVTILSYLPLWAGKDTFRYMASVGQKANNTLPGLIRDAAVGHLHLSLSHTIVQFLMVAFLTVYLIWHMFNIRSFAELVSASAGVAFLTPLALFWFQPWYLILGLGIIALRPWRLLYFASIASSLSMMFFDSFWWHTPVSIEIQKPMRVFVVFGPPVILLLYLKAKEVLPAGWKKVNLWTLQDSPATGYGNSVAATASKIWMALEILALFTAAAVAMAVVIATSPVLRSFADLVIVKLQLLMNI